jgi:predicted enzyme related to lactoylglutathione lyase
MGHPVTHWQIVAKNPARLGEFYTKLFSWDMQADNALGYRMIDTASERGIPGGIWPAPPDAPSFVQLFIEVDDVKRYVREATELGAKVIIAPQRLPEGDELAILHDPEGIPFGIRSVAGV